MNVQALGKQSNQSGRFAALFVFQEAGFGLIGLELVIAYSIRSLLEQIRIMRG